MWEDEEEEEDIIIPGTTKADELINSFIAWESGATKYFSENELEFLFNYYQYYNPGSDARVWNILQLGLDTFPNSGIFHICFAHYYLEKDMYDEALEKLQLAKLLDPMNPEVFILMAECLEEMEEYQQAFDILIEAEQTLLDFNQEIQIRLASLLLHFERQPEAVRKIARIIKHECGDDGLGLVSPMHFNSELLIEAVNLLINNHPFNERYWIFKGNTALLYMDDHDTAIEAFEYAHYINEKLNIPLFYLGICYKSKKQFNTAIKYFGEASEAGYATEECVIESAICMNRLGDHTQARFLLQNLLSDNITNMSEVNYEIAYSYLKQGAASKAIPYIEKSLSEDPNIQAYILYGEIACMLDDEDKLIECFTEAKEFRMLDYELFICCFFGMFYRMDNLTNMYEMLVLIKIDENKAKSSILSSLLNALIAKAEHNNIQYIQEMLNSFSIDAEAASEYIELIDEDLSKDPEITSLKEMF